MNPKFHQLRVLGITAICIWGAASASHGAVNIIGQKDLLGTGLTDLYSDGTPLPASWTNNSTARTLSLAPAVSLTADSIVTSELLDLSGVGAVNFTAKFHAHETSIASNFETGDRFKAELLYHVGGGILITVNLINQWDVGAGGAATSLPGVIGAPNGYLNGFSGTVGTDVNTAVVYATTFDAYNMNWNRDEFNLFGLQAFGLVDNTFDLAAQIPADATDVVLKVYGAGISGSEAFDVTDIKFQVPEPSAFISLLVCSLAGITKRRRFNNSLRTV
jgi:hypothetical protein